MSEGKQKLGFCGGKFRNVNGEFSLEKFTEPFIANEQDSLVSRSIKNTNQETVCAFYLGGLDSQQIARAIWFLARTQICKARASPTKSGWLHTQLLRNQRLLELLHLVFVFSPLLFNKKITLKA